MGGLPFKVFDHLQSFHITLAAVETCPQEGCDEVAREPGPDDLGAKAEHVHVVVLDALVRRIDVVADRRANPGQLAGRNRRAHTGAADEDAALRVAGQNRLADLAGLVGVVDAVGIGSGAQVHDPGPEAGDLPRKRVAELDASVVECNRHLHAWTVPHRQNTTPYLEWPRWTRLSSANSASSSASTRSAAPPPRSRATRPPGCLGPT